MELISHHLCPSLHTAIILLEKKGLKRNQDFTVTYVPIYDLPQSFFNLSPKGNMPVLLLPDNKFLVRSAAIYEYINETISPGFLPADAYERALHRELIIICSDLLNQLRAVFTGKEEAIVNSAIEKLFEDMKNAEEQLLPLIEKHRQVEAQLAESTFGAFFTLVLNFNKLKNDKRWNGLSTIKSYAEALVTDPIISGSRCPDYNEEFDKFFNYFGSLFKLMS